MEGKEAYFTLTEVAEIWKPKDKNELLVGNDAIEAILKMIFERSRGNSLIPSIIFYEPIKIEKIIRTGDGNVKLVEIPDFTGLLDLWIDDVWTDGTHRRDDGTVCVEFERESIPKHRKEKQFYLCDPQCPMLSRVRIPSQAFTINGRTIFPECISVNEVDLVVRCGLLEMFAEQNGRIDVLKYLAGVSFVDQNPQVGTVPGENEESSPAKPEPCLDLLEPILKKPTRDERLLRLKTLADEFDKAGMSAKQIVCKLLIEYSKDEKGYRLASQELVGEVMFGEGTKPGRSAYEKAVRDLLKQSD